LLLIFCLAVNGVKSNPALGETKRRIVDHLKRADATAVELARELGMTEVAVRQHLDSLEEHELVERQSRPPVGRGRPATVWRLTELARDLFPDRHGDLTVELLGAVREALGDEGLQRVIDTRADAQRRAYLRAVPKRGSLRARVEALARVRTAEGYVAEVVDDGPDLLLIEHHCPICTAAAACQGLCQSELELFREVLGPAVSVERTQHALAGDRRCAYRVSRVS
jgi:predicted ArsR family transcriptional regulator